LDSHIAHAISISDRLLPLYPSVLNAVLSSRGHSLAPILRTQSIPSF
jgi:hypothetical protein